MYPPELKYTPTHEWCRVEGESAVIGITQYAAEQLSDLVHIELPDAGDVVLNEVAFGEIESVKSVSDLHSPVEGEVEEANTALITNPEIVSKDPYNEGWMIRIKMDDPQQLADLVLERKVMSAEEYQALVEKEQ